MHRACAQLIHSSQLCSGLTTSDPTLFLTYGEVLTGARARLYAPASHAQGLTSSHPVTQPFTGASARLSVVQAVVLGDHDLHAVPLLLYRARQGCDHIAHAAHLQTLQFRFWSRGFESP